MPANTPPVVDAGPDKVVVTPDDTVNICGTVTDDGLPSGATLVAHTAKGSANGNTVTTDAIDTTGADMIVLAMSEYSSGEPISDSYGNTWTTMGALGFGFFGTIAFFYCLAPTAGAGHTFSCLPVPTGKQPALAVSAWSSIVALMDHGNTASATGTSADTDPLTPTAVGQLLVSALVIENADTVSAGAWTILDQIPASASFHPSIALAWNLSPSLSAMHASWTWANNSANHSAIIARFSTTSSGPTLTQLWTKISGPGTVTFSDDTALCTDATFSASGVYVLRLTADDGDLTAYDEMTVWVSDTPLMEEICPSGSWLLEIATVNKTSYLTLASASIEYNLGSQGNATITISDRGAVASAFRPGVEALISLTKGVLVFHGRIISAKETPIGDVDSGTASQVSAVDYHRALAKKRFTGSYGQYLLTYTETGTFYTKTDPEMIDIIVSNPGTVTTRYPHQLTTGDTVRFTNVANGVTPDINDNDYEVTVISDVQFTIPVNVTVQGLGGLIHKMTRLQTILQDVVDALTSHGVTLLMTWPGPWVMPQTFDQAWCEDVVNTVTREVGWVYRMRSEKVLESFAPGDVVASFTLRKDNSNIVGPPSIDVSDENYVNTLSVLYGDASLGVIRRVDRFIANGTDTSWALPTPYVTMGNRLAYGYVDVDGVHETLSLPGDVGTTWHLDPLTSLLSVDGSAPVVGTVLDLPYDGNAQARVSVSDPTAVAAVDGEIYEESWDAGNVSQATAIVKGLAELARRSVAARMLTLETFVCLVRPGTVIPCDFPSRNVSGDWLVTSVRMVDRDAARNDKKAFYTYALLEAGLPTTWIDFWRGL
jgi:hypothetical protein